MFRVTVACTALFALAACTSGSSNFGSNSPGGQQFAAGPSVISGVPSVAGPAACSGPISEYLSIINRDSETGSLSPSVFNRVSEDMDGVRKTCAANRDKEALTQLASVKKKYGYR
jgi:hypothetical protein